MVFKNHLLLLGVQVPNRNPVITSDADLLAVRAIGQGVDTILMGLSGHLLPGIRGPAGYNALVESDQFPYGQGTGVGREGNSARGSVLTQHRLLRPCRRVP